MKKLNEAKTALGAAREKVQGLITFQAEQVGLIAVYQSDLTRLEAGRTDKVIAAMGKDSKEMEKIVWAESQSITLKKAQFETCQSVSVALSPRIVAAKRQVVEAKAACFRAEADELDELASGRRAGDMELLNKIQEWEGHSAARSPLVVSTTDEMRKRADYYRECAGRILIGMGYRYDVFGNGNSLYPIPDYLGSAWECQPGE